MRPSSAEYRLVPEHRQQRAHLGGDALGAQLDSRSLLHHLAIGTGIGGHAGCSAGHRLQQGQRQALHKARQDEDLSALEQGAGIVLSTQGVTTQLRTLLPVLRDQPVLTAELGRKARLRALERYTISSYIDALEQLYADLMQTSTVAA